MSGPGTPEGPGAAGRWGLPEHEQRAWDAIVADLRGQLDLGPAFDEHADRPPLAADGDHPDPLAEPVELDEGDDEAERGYVPPEPPPLPRPTDTASRLSWAALLGGPVLAVGAGLMGWDDWLVLLGLAGTIGGFAALMARRRDREDDGSDGAVI